MPTNSPCAFWSTNWTLPNGGNVVAPLLLPGYVWVDRNHDAIAEGFHDTLLEDLEEGTYAATLGFHPPEALEHERITIAFGVSAKSQLFPDLSLEFDLWIGELPRGDVLCFVPVLGIEAWGETRPKARARGIEAIRFEFARRRRLKSPHDVLTTQWFRGIELERTELDLQFYSLHELKEIRDGKAGSRLPRAASLLWGDAPRRVFEVEDMLEGVARVLRGRFARSVLLVGSSGSGKSALVEELVRTARELGLPKLEMWETTGARLIQQLTRCEGWQDELAKICLELRDSGAVLFVRSLPDLFEVGQYEGNDVSIADYLRPYLERGEILLVSECTPEQLALIEARSPGYLVQFHQVRLEEADQDRIERITSARMAANCASDGILVEPEAIRRCVTLQRRFAPYSGYPGKTVRFLEALVERTAATGELSAIDEAVVTRAFCEEAGLPMELLDPAVPFPLDEISKHFRSEVFGQDEAIRVVVDLLASVKAGMVRGRRPIASLLFAGPTGVGKTELAKVTAEFMFGDRLRMIRFDMSEFSDISAVLRLTSGGCDGAEGLLTRKIRQEPFSLILFDEVEKAHPAFFDLLLQILGDGRLTDARGNTADFCSAIVVMTSNLGADDASKGHIGFGKQDAPVPDFAGQFEVAVQEHLRPELFNRIDRVVSFAPLDLGATRRIVDREVWRLLRRPGLAYRSVEVEFDTAALDRLSIRGHDWVYGARQLQRQLREDLAIPLARGLNKVEVDRPTSAKATPRDEEIIVEVGARVMGRKELRELRQLEQRETSNQLTNQRRLLQRLEESGGYANLVSEWTILDRKRQKDDRRFWKNETRAAKYTETGRVIEAFRDASRRIHKLEADCIRDLFVRKKPAHEPRSREATEDTWKVIQEIHGVLHPGGRHCVVGLYGHLEMVERLARVYTEIAKLSGFEVKMSNVHLLYETTSPEPTTVTEEERKKKPARKSRTRDYGTSSIGAPPPERAQRRVGVELGLAGSAVRQFFGGEEGLHELESRKVERKAVLAVMGGTLATMATRRPQDIHRSAFFQGKARRTWTERGFADRKLGTEFYKSESDVVPFLLQLLRKHGRNRICKDLDIGDPR